MGVLRRARRRELAGLVLGAVLAVGPLACGDAGEGGPGRYPAKGTVQSVDRERRQVLIEHEDVPGLMPAMTMSFEVPDRGVLESLAPGQVIEFEIEFTGRSYEVAEATVVGEAPAEEGWRQLGASRVRGRPAPDFELVDQAGRPVSLETWDDRVLLVDFIYTSCPGPCPAQTSQQVALQRKLPGAWLGDDVHFVSITLDPAVDSPEVLARYAREHGADLSSWSFLTGPEEALAEVARGFGVGSLRQPDGTIDHTLLTFLVQDGVVLDHYTSLDRGEGRLLEDVGALVRARSADADSGADAATDAADVPGEDEPSDAASASEPRR